MAPWGPDTTACSQSPNAYRQRADPDVMKRALYGRPGHPDWFTVLTQAQLCTPHLKPPPTSVERHLLSAALHIAARHDEVEAAGLLLARGADVNADMEPSEVEVDFPRTSALYECAGWRRGSLRVAALLLAHGADVSGEEGAKIMKAAVRHGHLQLLRMVARVAGPDVKGEMGATTLHYAASKGNVRAGRVLVECGAAVRCYTDLGLDVEAVARKHEQAEFIEWMYLSGLVVPPPSSNAIVRCHAGALVGVFGGNLF